MFRRKQGGFTPKDRSRANIFVELLVGTSFIFLFVVGATISFSSEYLPLARGFFLTIGIIAVWRYSWLFWHLWRARKFSREVFPELREGEIRECEETRKRIEKADRLRSEK